MKKLLFVFLAAIVFVKIVSASSTASFFYVHESDSSLLLSDIIRTSAAMFQVVTNDKFTCKYSVHKGVSYGNMEKEFDLSLETIHKKEVTGLEDGVYSYYVRCKNESEFIGGEMEAKFRVSLPVSAQIVLEDEEVVRAGKTEVTVVTSKILSEAPTLSYSFDGVSYSPIPLFGSGTTWKGFLMISNTPNEEIGSFKFQGRDLEGFIGSEVTKGGIFIVDTKKPSTITDLTAEGRDGEVRLSWHFEEGDVKEYKIYRSTSTGVGKSELYKSVTGKSYTDTDVERGVTYYYRINAVDDAGNEGDLSREIYATVLLNEVSNTQTGLELRFHGLVDSFLSEISLVEGDVRDVKVRFENKEGVEGELYDDLRLSRDIDSAITEIGSLRNEVENYKNQRLSNTELDKKLNSAQLKLNTIKRKVPDNLIIASQRTENQVASEDDLLGIILTLNPAASERLANDMVESSVSLAEQNSFKVKTEGYNLEIVFMDGSRKEVSLIKEEIDSVLGQNDSLQILEVIPTGIAGSASSLNIKNVNYNVVKDSVISFGADTKEIIYSIDGFADLSQIGRIRTVVYQEMQEKPERSLLTGYASLVSFEGGGSYLGLIIGFVVVLSLTGYYLFVKKSNGVFSSKLIELQQNILRANDELSIGKVEFAKDIYNAASFDYRTLNKEEKKIVYGDLETLHRKLSGSL